MLLIKPCWTNNKRRRKFLVWLFLCVERSQWRWSSQNEDIRTVGWWWSMILSMTFLLLFLPSFTCSIWNYQRMKNSKDSFMILFSFIMSQTLVSSSFSSFSFNEKRSYDLIIHLKIHSFYNFIFIKQQQLQNK